MTATYAQLGSVQLVISTGAPSNGTTGTGAGTAAPGSLLIDVGNSNLYVNSNTRASPTWTLIGVAALTASLSALDGVTPGLVTLSKAVIVDASKDIGDFRNLDAVNIDAGKSGAAGTVDVFPATASKGKFSVTCADQTGDTTVTMAVAGMGQATQVNLADPGAAAAYYVLGTAQITLAEADVLDAATAGSAVASKAMVLDANKDYAGVRNFTVGTNGVGGAAGSLVVRDGANPGAAITLTYADVAPIDGVTAGTVAAGKAVVADANKDVSEFRHLQAAGAVTLTGGAAAPATVFRFGDTATEGLEYRVIDEAVTLTNAVEVNLTTTVPAGAVILSAQGNLATAITGDGSGDDLLAKVGIGVTADPDKYGKSADLNKNTKIDCIPAYAVLATEETVCVKAAKTDGSACTEKFTAAGVVRVRIVYAVPNSLDDAA